MPGTKPVKSENRAAEAQECHRSLCTGLHGLCLFWISVSSGPHQLKYLPTLSDPCPQGKSDNGGWNDTCPIHLELVWLVPSQRRNRKQGGEKRCRKKSHGQNGNCFHRRGVLTGRFGERSAGIGDLHVRC